MGTTEAELNSLALRRVGMVLRGKYRIDRVLGVGGMAAVYKVTHRNQAEFALKMLHSEMSLRDDVRNRFLREGYAANSVKHPGVVVVVDDDVSEDGAAFLVMELLHGAAVETLWERSGHRMPVPAVLSLGDQLLDVLIAAHDKGIVHRDIKPANLFVAPDGMVKVLDFGIARVRDAAASQPGLATGAGVLLGTPAFMAPEQAYAMASEIDGQTDVWAVGATLFTLLSGQSVHEGENAAQLMIRAATAQARPLLVAAPGVPPSLARIIDRALAFEKPDRWPSAAAMREALLEASQEVLGHAPEWSALAALVEPLAGTTRSRPLSRRASAPASTPPDPHPMPKLETPKAPGLSTTSRAVSSDRRASVRPRRNARLALVAACGAAAIAGAALAFRPSPAQHPPVPPVEIAREAMLRPAEATPATPLPSAVSTTVPVVEGRVTGVLSASAAPATHLAATATARAAAHAPSRPSASEGATTPSAPRTSPAASAPVSNPLDIPIK